MLVLVFIGIVLLCFILLYKSGRLTSAKMELQNGADAAAYSASTLEARALNFCAYTNRAMAANEVGIAQMVGMLSWADEFQNVVPFEAVYEGIPIVDLFIDAVYDAIAAVGTPIHELLEGIAPFYIKALSTTNKVYSVSQEVYYDATLALVASSLFQNLNNNVPGTDFSGNVVEALAQNSQQDRDGARVSKFGLLALVGHATSYLTTFTERYSMDGEDDLEGMGRLAATIREGRDGFSSGRRCGANDPARNKPECENRDWGLTLSLKVDLKVIKASVDMGMTSYGGTELRFKKNDLTDGHTAIWSAGDSAVMGGKASLKLKFLGKTIWDKHIELPGLPFLGGRSQATGGLTFLTPVDMIGPLYWAQEDKDIPEGAYGNADDVEHMPAWTLGMADGVSQVPDDPYTNLRAYRDLPVDDEEDSTSTADTVDLPFKAPFFIVGLVRNMDEIEKKPSFSGNFALDSGKSYDGKVAALAKSEVYFSRPDDPKYFRREDGRTEKPSLFSPFWQARLVKTTETDRLLALAAQQDIIWIKDFTPVQPPSFNELVKELEKILKTYL